MNHLSDSGKTVTGKPLANHKHRPRKLVAFDMDGVIIDVSGSYRDVVRQTARLFFKNARSWEKLPDPLFSLADLAAVKQSGGLNNDWDLTARVIGLLFSQVERPDIQRETEKWRLFEYTISRCDVSPLAAYLKSCPNPLTLLQEGRETPDNDWILNFYAEDVGSGNIIKQIFQEIYLGRHLFKTTYGVSPKIYQGEGYIHREKLLIEKAVLAKLSKDYTLAIATGRPRSEADFALDLFDIRKYFKPVYTLDECIREEKRIWENKGEVVSLSKPNPYMLDAIAAEMKGEACRYYYIGDMPDDMAAAGRSKAGFVAIGIIFSAPEKEKLKKNLMQAGADYIIDTFDALDAILK